MGCVCHVPSSWIELDQYFDRSASDPCAYSLASVLAAQRSASSHWMDEEGMRRRIELETQLRDRMIITRWGRQMKRTRSRRVFQCMGAYSTLLVLAGCSHALDRNGLSQDEQAAVGRITAERLSGYIKTISSDEYEGRGPATAADLRTQQYLADQLDAMGLEPGGPDGSWVQEFDVVGITSEVPKQ